MRRLIAILAGFAVSLSGVAPTASAVPAASVSDEDQVRAVLDGMNGAYNREDFASFAAHVCAPMRLSAGFAAEWYANRRADGPTQITVSSVRVAGEPSLTAAATVRFAAANKAEAKIFDIDFLREGSEWKACRYHPARAI
ncbi:transcriptional regulator [Mycobacterium sp. 852002-51961_SCH5331710]|uniref:Rv0361 family membrane protein n=1 Tax=Mycobacterium sp. 852002-51961_SCH5331710 TaxID=1834105 RepID=UPI000AAB86B9|nr:transcriptional regulator [Mycobacterium sp. 852002-51961_SCH5331710]